MELPVIQPPRRGEGQPPIFQKIGIVDLGLIGGSIALAARELWPSSLVIAVDNKDVLETAMRLHAIDVAADDLIVLAEADIVVLAAPARQNISLLNLLDEAGYDGWVGLEYRPRGGTGEGLSWIAAFRARGVRI